MEPHPDRGTNRQPDGTVQLLISSVRDMEGRVYQFVWKDNVGMPSVRSQPLPKNELYELLGKMGLRHADINESVQ